MPTPWLDADQQRAWRRFLRAGAALADQLEAELKREHDLDLGEYEVMAHLSETVGERLRMSDLADRVLVSRSRLTHLVDRLATAGLVRREQCPHDRRGLFAVLTPKGRAAIEAAAPTHVAGVRRYLVDAVSAHQLRTVDAAMGHVLAALDDEVPVSP